MPPRTDPFDSAVAEVVGRSARGSLHNAAPLDPDKEAEHRQLARDTGLSIETVRNAPNEARLRAIRQGLVTPEVEQALRAAPRAAAWLSRPDNAAIARDDVGPLAAVGAVLRGKGATPGGFLASIGLGLASRITQPGYFTGTTASDFGPRNLGKSVGAGLAGLASGVAGVVEGGAELYDRFGVTPRLERAFGQPSSTAGLIDLARRRRQGWAEVQQAVRPDTGSPFARDIHSGVESVPSSLGAAAVTLTTGNPFAGAAVLGGVTGGQSYGEARDEGLTVEGAALKAGVDAIVETGTEMLPERALLGLHGNGPLSRTLLDVLGKEIVGEQAATLGQDFNQWVAIDANKGKSFDDYIAEIGPHALSTLTATITTTGLLAGPGALYRSMDRVSDRAAQREARAAEAEAAAQHLQQMAELAAASKLRERDPRTFQDFVAQAAEDGPVEAVYVSPDQLGEVLNQSGLEPEQMNALGEALAGPLAEAKQNGTDVRLPIEAFAAHLAGTPAGSKLIEHLKTDPNGMSLAEAKEFMSSRGADLQAEVEAALEEAKGDAAFRESAERVEAAIANMLHAANRFTREVNEANASGMAAFYATMAARMGMTPEELFARFPIRVQAEGVGELDQLSPLQKFTAGVALALSPAGAAPDTQPIAVPGLVEQGNIDLHARPVVKNADGTISTVRSISIGTDKGEVLIPTVVGGEVVDDETAIRHYEQTGEHLGIFDTSESATTYAKLLHDAQAQEYEQAPKRSRPVLTLGMKPEEYRRNSDTSAGKSAENELYQSDMPHFAFFSPLERAVEQSKQQKATGQQWLATLSKTSGVKKEEIEWTGLPEWLGSREGTFTRDEVLAFVRAGGIEVEEVELSVTAEIDGGLLDERTQALLDERYDDTDAEPQFYPPVPLYRADGSSAWEFEGEEYETQQDAQDAHDAAEARALEQRRVDFDNANWDDARADAEIELRNEIDSTTKFEQYTEDGGEDYRELLLTLPEGVGGNPTESFRESGHFGDEPVIAHLRFKTRRTTDGRSVMFIEEIQSDWHQQGRDKGYAANKRAVEAARKVQSDASAAWHEWHDRAIALGVDRDSTRPRADLTAIGTPEALALAEEGKALGEKLREAQEAFSTVDRAGIPDAPFKNTWPALVMKRAIRWAVDSGIEQVAWTTGEQQRERYGLAQMVGPVSVAKAGDRYQVHTRSNSNVISAIVDRHFGEFPSEGSVFNGGAIMTAEQIVEVFGKELGGRMVTLADQAAPSAEIEAAYKKARAFEDNLTLAILNGDSEAAAAARREGIERHQEALDAYSRAQRNSEVTLDGEDLKIGGEGMLAFYDRNLVNIANNIIKKHGGKVTTLPVEGMAVEERDAEKEDAFKSAHNAFLDAVQAAGLVDSDVGYFDGLRPDQMQQSVALRFGQEAGYWQGQADRFADMAEKYPEDAERWNGSRTDALERVARYRDPAFREAAPALVEKLRGLRDAKDAARDEAKRAAVKPSNPGFEITPELKAAALGGFTLFQSNRGAYSPATDTITLLKTADLSTFLHESGHFYLEMLDRLAADPNAPQDVRDDFDTILKWFGVKDAATWRSYSLEQKRVHHEKWARGFEAYLFSGKPPSFKLQALFQRFRQWLIAVYGKAVNLGVRPTEEIRAVMDRMLATDDEIAIAEQARSMLPLFADRDASGLDEHGWREYQRQATDATQQAVGDLEARSMRDLRWIAAARSREINKLKRQARAIRAAVTRDVTREIMAEPVYRAMDYLKRGQLDGAKVADPVKLSIEQVDALYPDEAERAAVKAKLGYGAYGMLGTENAIHPEQAAELFGFTSADHLIRALVDAAPVKERVAGLVEQRLLEGHGELADDRAIEDAATKAIHNDARARVIATELAALNQLAGKPKTLNTAARAYAKEIVARLKVRNLKPSLYEAAGTRAGKAAMEALAAGNRSAAAAEKRNQLINVYAAKAAIGAKEEVDDALAYFARLLRPAAAKSIDRSYLDQIEGLLSAVDLRTGQSLKAIDKRTSLAEWIEQQRELGLDPIVPPDLLEQLGKRSYKDMTVEELRGLRDAIKNIEHLGRLKNRLLTAHKEREFSKAVGLLVDSIKQFAYKDVTEPLEKRGWLAKAKEGVFDFITDHRKLASLAREMDGLKDGGAVWEYFIRAMNEAAAREANMRSDAAKRLAEILAPIGSFGTKQYIPEIGQSLSLEGRLAVALNTGNAINRERLLSGENWSPDQLAVVLSTLTAEQWGVVQAVWDFIGSYWPEIAAKEQRVTGVAPERVEAEPLRVVTSDGHELELPGGYYPIKYNSRRSMRAAGNELAEQARAAMLGARSAAQTRRGHTKARVESTGMALRYDLGVITQHVTEVIHDLTHHEMLIDTTRLLRASPVNNAIRAHYGPEVVDAFRKTIEAVAAGDVAALDAFERGVNYLRNGVTVAGLGWNLFTSLLQPLGLAQSVVRIGPKWVGKGIAKWVGDAAHLENSVRWIAEQSPMMASRSRTLMREISEIRNTIDGKSAIRNAVEASFFILIAKMQLVADVPTWLGQYEKSVAAGEDHERAVALADQAVLDSQGGGQAKDLAAIQRGSPLKKLWTTFYSYFSTTYNLLAESVNETRRVGPKRLPLLAVDFLLLTMIPNTLNVLMRAALHGEPPDEEDLIGQNVGGLFNLMLGAREIGVLVTGGRQAGPAGLFYGPFSELYQQTKQGEADEAFWRSVNRSAGVLFHYPAGQVDRTVRGAEALGDGRTSNPMALIVGPPRTGT